MIVDKKGETLVKYQRVSPGAWVPEANVEYRRGKEFPVFEFMHRSQILAKPVFFVNNFRLEADEAKGGAYVWRQGTELAALEPGQEGLLRYDFK